MIPICQIVYRLFKFTTVLLTHVLRSLSSFNNNARESLLFLNCRVFHTYNTGACIFEFGIWMLIARLALAYICGAIYKFRAVVERLIYFCRGRANVNGNVDHNVVKPRGTTLLGFVLSSLMYHSHVRACRK